MVSGVHSAVNSAAACPLTSLPEGWPFTLPRCLLPVGRSPGNGVVEYGNEDDMKYAVKKLDDTEFVGNFNRGKSFIRVREERRGGGGGGGSGGAGAGGRRRCVAARGPTHEPLPYDAHTAPKLSSPYQSCAPRLLVVPLAHAVSL